MERHTVVSHDEWLAARVGLLREEKEFTQLRDHLNERRRELPWEAVDKAYEFEASAGMQSLSDLFDGRSQLVVYHAMFHPAMATPSTTWTEDAACQACSFWVDNFVNVIVHLNHRDVTLVASSRAPYPKIAAYQHRMGWVFPWVSSGDSDFNFDYGVSFTPEQLTDGGAVYNYARQNPNVTEREGLSVFAKDDEGAVFHTYSAYARGIDMVNVAYHFLDLVPKGRDEAGEGLSWVRRHDEY